MLNYKYFPQYSHITIEIYFTIPVPNTCTAKRAFPKFAKRLKQ